MNKLLIGLVNVYKKFISPILPPTCRYYPTCSSYMIDALKKQGYVLVNNSFDPSDKPTFSNEDVQTYTISFKHGIEAIDKPNSDLGISESDLQKVGTQTIHYEGAAARTPKDNVKHVTFKRSVVYDKVLKK